MKLGIPASRLALMVSLSPLAGAQLGDTPEAQDRLGSAMASGDFNGDGIADLAVSAPGETVNIVFPPASFAQAGVVHVVYGAPGPIAGLVANKKVFRQATTTASVPGLGVGNDYGSALVSGDFNGDGFDDLAIGIPGQKINGFAGAGAVQLQFGKAQGLGYFAPILFHQDVSGVLDAAEANDAFGTSLCAGDFNGDGFDDLAVGAPTEKVGSVVKAGAVNVLFGAANMLQPVNSFWTQGAALQNPAEIYDHFGQALAAGDLNGDGFDDLAVGVPGEDLLHMDDGLLHVIFGSGSGLLSGANQVWHQEVPGVEGVSDSYDEFASALVARDLDLDGICDLAVGIPGEVTNGIQAGGVQVLFGRSAGLGASDDLMITQDYEFLFEELEEGDRFGASLTTWDQGPGFVSLVIGVPGETIGQVFGAGMVEAVGISSLRQIGSTLQFGTPTLSPQPEDGLGSAVATGDFTGDGHGDLAFGVPYREHQTADAGVFLVLYQSDPFQETWHQGD